MNVSQFFTASLTSPAILDLHAVQGDGGRIVEAQLYAGAEPWMVPEGVTARISYKLPDGTRGCYELLDDGTPACTIKGNHVAATIATNLCLIPGLVQAAIVLRKDGNQISTFPFHLHVTERPGTMELDPGADAVPTFVGKLYYGDIDGTPVPLAVGDGLVVEDGRMNVWKDPDTVGKGYVDEQIAALRAEMIYEPIAVTGVSIRPGIVQMGQTVEDPVVTWTVSREPTALTVNGVPVDSGAREYVLDGEFTADRDAVVRAVDERGAVSSATASMRFYNAVYYTDHCAGRGLPLNKALWEMPFKLQSGRRLTIAADAGEGEYILYAIPSRYGTPKFWCNGLQAAFEKVGTLDHINQFRYQEAYDVWISEADGLSGVDIIVE